jgi:hypothetical protein
MLSRHDRRELGSSMCRSGEAIARDCPNGSDLWRCSTLTPRSNSFVDRRGFHRALTEIFSVVLKKAVRVLKVRAAWQPIERKQSGVGPAGSRVGFQVATPRSANKDIPQFAPVVTVKVGLVDDDFGRGQTILLERERIKRHTIKQRRLNHQANAA